MKVRLAIIHLLFTYAVYGQTVSYDYDPGKLYPVDSLKADLRFLQTRLEKMHPGLYRYATREEITGLIRNGYSIITFFPITDSYSDSQKNSGWS
jgi:hypothetical protein